MFCSHCPPPGILRDDTELCGFIFGLKDSLDPHQRMFLSISPLERKTVPSFSQSSVPSLPASLAAVESKLSVPQSPPRSPLKSPLEVRLYPQPYFQTRTQHQAQQLKKIEPPLQSPVKLKPKVVSTALVRFLQQCFPFPSVGSSGSVTGGKCAHCGGTAVGVCVGAEQQHLQHNTCGAYCTVAIDWFRIC